MFWRDFANRAAVPLVMAAAVVHAAGCSPIDKRQARSLAETGEAATQTTGVALDVTQRGISQTVDLRELVRAVRPADYRPVPAPIRAEVARTGRIWSLRQVAMRELVDTYQAFRTLTMHEEAAVETSEALAETIQAINAWNAEVRVARGETASPLLSDTLGGVIEAEDSLFEGRRLRSAIGNASARLRAVLEGVATVLTEERVLIGTVHARTAEIRTTTDVWLWQAGILESEQRLDSLLADRDLPIRTRRLDPHDPGNPHLEDWIGNIHAEALQREAGRIRRTYDLAIELARRLIRAHHRMEDGERVDRSLIQNRIRQLADTTNTKPQP